ncbi:MAG: LptF/LptG family permease [Solirubrobacteraceae bacterium]
MIKQIDKYVLNIYLRPFVLIFIVLFFLLISTILWSEMERIVGKGLDFFTISKLFFLLGLTVVQIALPITILWASIMAIGELGENYELSALKASGIPLYRIILPLFLLSVFMSIGLFFFLDKVTPAAQKKAKNLLIDITEKKPTLSFKEGVFITGIPGIRIKVKSIFGDNKELLSEVFIHKDANFYEDNYTIVSKRGIFKSAENRGFIKLQLFDGYIYNKKFPANNHTERLRQKNQTVKFDTLIQYFDVSELLSNSNDNFEITNYYKFFDNNKIKKLTDSLILVTNKFDKEQTQNNYIQLHNDYILINDTIKKSIMPINLNILEKRTKEDLLRNIKNIISQKKISNESQIEYFKTRQKELNKVIFYYNSNFSYPLICIVFFLIGSSLGAIIRKGGLAVPFLVSTVIFLIFWILNLTGESLSLINRINPKFGPWLGIIFLSPLSLIFTYMAVTDSQFFNIDNYLNPFKNIITKFVKNKEHKRYQ